MFKEDINSAIRFRDFYNFIVGPGFILKRLAFPVPAVGSVPSSGFNCLVDELRSFFYHLCHWCSLFLDSSSYSFWSFILQVDNSSRNTLLNFFVTEDILIQDLLLYKRVVVKRRNRLTVLKTRNELIVRLISSLLYIQFLYKLICRTRYES